MQRGIMLCYFVSESFMPDCIKSFGNVSGYYSCLLSGGVLVACLCVHISVLELCVCLCFVCSCVGCAGVWRGVLCNCIVFCS